MVVGCGAAAMKTLNVLVPPGTLVDGTEIDLEETEAHHLRVRRVDAFADVRLFDGSGTSARGSLTARGQVVSVTVGIVQHAPPVVPTLLAVGAGDKDRFLSLAERCTELGVTQLIPLTTERSQAVDTRFRDSWLEKARRRAREACKQSENPWATSVDEACALSRLGDRYPRVNWLVGAMDGDACPRLAANEAVGWIIGPEGGLTAEEIQFTVEKMDASTVTFGSTILRFDTAAVAAATLTLDRRRAKRD
jgi:16S rRNA (uracil1498-N3)-methyltransferase